LESSFSDIYKSKVITIPTVKERDQVPTELFISYRSFATTT